MTVSRSQNNPIRRPVVAITGTSAGVGPTARLFASEGYAVVSSPPQTRA